MIRVATSDDAPAIRDVYAPYVVQSAASFELDVPSASDIAERITASHRWLVHESDDGVVDGYAYSAPFAARAAYRWAAELSVYLDASTHRRGVGRALVTALLDDLRDRGFVHAFAGITLPNAGSQRLFESLGFVQQATYANIGHKFDAWHSVGWWQLQLVDELPDAPRAPS